MNYKNMIIWYFISIFVIGFSFFFILWFVDPLKLFHKPFICENTIYDSARYSARGLIDTMDFDSVILGTSMLENTSAKEASDKLGGKFINISISGSTFYERNLILRYLLTNKKEKMIIYSLDKSYILEKTKEQTKNFNVANYDFLYDDSLINDIKSYLNAKYIAYSIKTLFTFGKKCKITDFNRPFAWHMLEDHKKRFGGIQMWAKYSNNSQLKSEIEKIKNVADEKIDKRNSLSFKENLDNNILYFAKNYPQTKFILVIPPYSRVQSAMYVREPGLFSAHKNAIKYLLDQNLSNVKIYAFDDMNFTADIANYKDLGHYSEEINSKMLDWIAGETGLLTLENFDEWWQNYEKLAKDFDLEGFNNELQRLIKENKESGIPK